MKTWRDRRGNKTSYTAQVNIDADDGDKVTDNFWPDGILCRPYIPRSEMTYNRDGDWSRKHDWRHEDWSRNRDDEQTNRYYSDDRSTEWRNDGY